jgi:glucokinase
VSTDQPPGEASALQPTQTGDFIGVDLGGTKISIAVMHAGVLAEPTLEPTDRSSQDALIDQLVAGIERARRGHSGEPLAVGVGVPSVIEFPSGLVRSSVNVPLAQVALGALLSERLGGIEVFIDNDATCAALAEAHDQHGGLDSRQLVMFTVGTGVGGGIIIDGRPYRGATGAAGEVGHMIIGLDLGERVPDPGEFPQPGSLEALASGRALDQLARSIAREYPDSALGRAASTGAQLTGPDVLAGARAGDQHALAALTLLGRRLGIGIANVINIFDPEVVAIGGGVSEAHELLLDHARQTAERFVLPGVGTRTEIRLARSGPRAGVRGAALLASQEYSGRPHAGESPR